MLNAAAAPAATAAPAAVAAAPKERVISPLRGTTQPMSRLRKVLAERAVASMQQTAQLTTVVEVDVTKLAAYRDEVKGSFQQKTGDKLSFLPFFALAAADACEHGTDGDGLVLGGHDLLQGARNGRGDLGVDLVGGDLEQRLVDGHVIADLLQPAGDRALRHALAQLGQAHVGRVGRGGGGRGGCGLGGGRLGSGSLRGRSSGGLSGLGGRSGRRGRAGAVADACEDRADLDRVVLGDEDLLDHAADGGRDLGVDLVGRDLEQSLVGLNGVADLLEPTGHRALGDALSEGGKDHGCAHDGVSLRKYVMVISLVGNTGFSPALISTMCKKVFTMREVVCPQERGRPRPAPRSASGARGSTGRCPRGGPPSSRRAGPR
ncbi:Dihydrolipoyllysine-residue acetyltransferase component of pyruvate dehydrogenase complex [Microbacterium azadirachtae]|uniref:Dihydrolipoyllysine-residue acetyltransferase component of pyruvate dehydrogenase complex n=1 Tax=Microbacterium azadirachtae TaxID=582680 RepID=A0A0F0KEC5_9MICO|nr:Dihydrolipoyllysine-residue acetyltransferase component of pyruvate dehydrogenase complex [Microbacterium azadirachtae]